MVSLEGLPSECQPDSKLTDELAAEVKRLKDKGIRKPFVNVDLAKWVPDWCNDGAELAEDPSSSEDEAASKTLRTIAKALKPQKEQVSCLLLFCCHYAALILCHGRRRNPSFFRCCIGKLLSIASLWRPMSPEYGSIRLPSLILRIARGSQVGFSSLFAPTAPFLRAHVVSQSANGGEQGSAPPRTVL